MQPKRLPRPQAVLFDWDGTLANTIPIIQQGINHVLNQLGEPPAPFGSGVLASVAGSTGLFKHLLGEERGTLAKQIYEEHLDELYRAEGGPVGKQLARDGALDVLKFLQQRDIPAGIVTNKRRYRFQLEAEAMGLTPYLAATCTLDDVINRKPHPEMMLLGASRLGLPPTPAIWVVGDHRIDTESAKQAGITAIHLEDGYDVSPTHPPDAIAANLSAVITMIEEAE